LSQPGGGVNFLCQGQRAFRQREQLLVLLALLLNRVPV
jgi:hypothetical protein